MILAGDIGGTKAVFALYEVRDKRLFQVVIRKYHSQAITSLDEAVLHFIRGIAHQRDTREIKAACFSIAAPIYGSAFTFSNLPLTINPAQIKKQLSFISQMDFINDLEALGHGLLVVDEKDFFCLYPGRSTNNLKAPLNKAIIAPGTGLGEALIMAGKYVYPTEGGHGDFAPQTETEIELLRFLKRDYEHVSYERLLSGSGLINIYRFLCHQYNKTLPATLPLAEQISDQGLTGHCPICQEAMEIFVRILGAEAGNLALRSLSFGGIYLGGGIPPKILPKLREEAFFQGFFRKGRFTTMLRGIPIYVILNEQTPLKGAAWFALKKLCSPEDKRNDSI